MTSNEQTRSGAGVPVIAVTSRWRQSHGEGWPRAYLTALATAGGEGTVLDMDRSPAALADQAVACSGVLLSGGGDVAPTCYGEERHPLSRSVDESRDRAEKAIIRAAVAADKPVLAICRGIQILNVALGGSLVQDIPSLVPSAAAHGRKYERKELATPYVCSQAACSPAASLPRRSAPTACTISA